MNININLWKNEIQEWFCKYVLSKDLKERNKIYKIYLHEPFVDLIHSEIEKYGKNINFYSSDLRDNFETDMLAVLIQQIDYYNVEKAKQIIETKNKGHAYFYCKNIIRSNIADRFKKEWNKHKKFQHFEEKDK